MGVTFQTRSAFSKVNRQGLDNETQTLANIVLEDLSLYILGLVANLHWFNISSVRKSVKVELVEQ